MSSIKLNRFRLKIFVLQTALLVVLEQIYARIVYPEYGYMGFTLSYDITRLVIGKIVFIFVLIIILAFTRSTLLLAILNFVLTFFLVPNVILYEYMDTDPLILVGGAALPIFTVFFRRLTIGQRKVSLPAINEHQKIPFLSTIAVLLFLPFLYTYGNLISWEAFNFERIYEIREESARLSNRLLNYIYSPLSTWIFPLCIILGYLKRRWLLCGFGVFGLLYLFTVTGNRITFFVIIVILGFLFFRTVKKQLLSLYLSLGVLYTFGFVFYEQIPHIVDLLVRRFLFLPALLNHQYFEFFEGEPIYYSHSFLSSFFNYNFDKSPSLLIGEHYYGEGVNATNGIIADGYINLGYPGIFINTAIAAFTLSFFDRFEFSSAYLGLFFLLVQRFIDAALPTLFLTHGLLLFMALAFLLMKNTKNRSNFISYHNETNVGREP